MKFKPLLNWFLFCSFAMLYGYELKTNIEARARQNNQSVKYVRNMKRPVHGYQNTQIGTDISKKAPTQMPDYNFDVILKHTDTGG